MILVEDIMGFILLLGVRLDASVNFFSDVMMKSASVARSLAACKHKHNNN